MIGLRMSEKKITLRELVENIDFKLTHLEDIEADNRELIIKLIKQGNTIVEFLKQFVHYWVFYKLRYQYNFRFFLKDSQLVFFFHLFLDQSNDLRF